MSAEAEPPIADPYIAECAGKLALVLDRIDAIHVERAALDREEVDLQNLKWGLQCDLARRTRIANSPPLP